jgi:hypothetical protein
MNYLKHLNENNMKKIIRLFVVGMFCGVSIPSFAQSGKNCFNTQFNKDATSLNNMNGYLLSYLSTS